jgi:ribosomal protein L24E
MYICKDGTVLWFISSKAQKNYLKLKRDPRFLKWTGAYKKGGKRSA